MKKIVVATLVIILLLLLGSAGCVAGRYNQLVTLSESMDNSWAQVETVLQRRYDLIPNLVNTVKGFAAQEREVLTEVTRLRSQWGAARTTAEKARTAAGLEGALGRLMVVIERYPELKSNQNFLALQDELAGTENRIAVERRRYNESVRAYNTSVRRFPTNIVAALTGFERQSVYFEAAAGAQEAPRVDFQ